MATNRQRRKFNWKALRVVVQALSFLVVTAYFLSLVYPLDPPWRPDLLFQLDPLQHLYMLLSGNGVASIAWAVAALVLVFAVSRIFCGWLCPLGAMLDFVSGIRGRLKLWNGSRLGPSGDAKPGGGFLVNRPRQQPLLPRNFSIYLLLALLVPAIFGNPVIWLFDPIVFSFKFLTIAVKPVLDGPLGTAFTGLDNALYQHDWWYPVQHGYNTYISTGQATVFADTALFLCFALVIFALEMVQRRFWCRYLCPLGAILRLTFKLHPLRRRITPQCTHCLKCEAACHFGGTAEHDCIYCMECINSCNHGAVTFLPTRETLPAKEITGEETPAAASPKTTYRCKIDGQVKPQRISRRLMLQYTTAGLVATPALGLFDKRIEPPVDLIRPPGVGDDEAAFTEKCIKCGQCLKVCLTNGLQPALTETGLRGLWTPRLIFRQGTCEFDCNLCGQVCPTGAIPKLTLEEKQRTQLGIAWFDKMRCIPYIAGHACIVCEEHCPTADKAIKLRPRTIVDEDGVRQDVSRPYVEEKLCIGCGICEYVCPVPGQAAIRVFRRPPGPAFTLKGNEPAAEEGYGDYAGDYGGDYGSSPGGDYPGVYDQNGDGDDEE